MRALKLLAALLLLATVAGGGYWVWSTRQPAAEDDALTLYGNVDIRQVDLAFNAEGKIAELLVEEGDRVEADQLLARLKGDMYADLVAAAEARVTESEARLDELQSGTRQEEIARARAAVRQAQAMVEETRSTLQRRRQLLASDNISEQAFDEARRAYDEAEAVLAQRRAELELAEQGPRAQTIRAAEARLAFDRATLRLARERRDNTTLLAPAAGTVLTRIREPGATVGPTTPVLTLALRDPVRVRTYVGEPNLGRVVPGMPVTVTTDSFPDRTYQGQVGYISPSAEFTPKSVETPELRTDLVYRVRVIVTNPDQGLRQGMPVSVHLRPGDGDGPAR
jgi:HlyD family secretion protein